MAPAVLALTLLVPDAPVPVGQTIPVTVVLRNVSDRSVWTTGVLDGSEEGLRYPHFLPVISRDGETVAAPGPVEDPLVSPLRLDDFRLLQPGESFDPTRAVGRAGAVPLSTFVNFRPSEPGVYELTLTYSTESASPEDWLGRFSQDAEREAVLGRVAEIPRLTLTATVTVTVR